MRSSTAQLDSRRGELAVLIRKEGYLSVSELSRRFQVSEATIRRDLNVLQQKNQITRTHGGALSEYDTFFTSFYERNSQHRVHKQHIARAVLRLLEDRQTVFLDAGSTLYAVAQEVADSNRSDMRIVTNSLPIAEVFASRAVFEVHLLGGQLLPHQLIVVGLGAGLSLSAWQFDLAILGAQSMNREGLWNSQGQIADFQRHVCGRSDQNVFCVDATKLDREGPSFLLRWQEVDRLVTTASEDVLKASGVILTSEQFVHAPAEPAPLSPE